MENKFSQEELCSKLNIHRKTLYFWRLQGLPYELNTFGHISYIYNLSDVRKWMKENKKGKYKKMK